MGTAAEMMAKMTERGANAAGLMLAFGTMAFLILSGVALVVGAS